MRYGHTIVGQKMGSPSFAEPEVGMLNDAILLTQPFSHVTGTTQIPQHQLQKWMELFDDAATWQCRTESFYSCALREVTPHIDEVWRAHLRDAVTRLLHIPLVPLCTVTAQKMSPGQRIGVHSDQPRLGFEIARVVLQLNKEWCAGDGGALEVYSEMEAAPALSHPPRWNTATAFILHPESFHSVSRTQKIRCSLVFNFWHPGNTPKLGRAVEKWLDGLHFGKWPESLDKEASDAEQHLDEARTYRAGVVAWLLQRWGYGEDVVLAGYRSDVGYPIGTDVSFEGRMAISWACWVAQLHRGAFCPYRWAELQRESRWEAFPRLVPHGQLLFPATSG